MINIQKGLESYKQLATTIKGVNDINSLVELIYDNPKYDITNDLRDNEGMIDINYKNICATIKQEKNSLVVLPEIEVWDENKTLDFVSVNMVSYMQYHTTILEDGKLYVYFLSPYDEQNYYYVIDNKICRDGKIVEEIVEERENSNITEIDDIILRLMSLNISLKPIASVD